MPPEGMQPVRVGSRNQRLAKLRCNFRRAAIRIQETLVKMAKFNRVETIYFSKQTPAN